jgi:hypothetical protein
MASAEKHAGATLRALSRPSLVAGASELNLWLRGASKSFGESQMEYFARRKKVSGLDTLNKHVKKNMALVVLASLVHLAGPAHGASEKHSIDSSHSKITMHVYKAGLFSGLAHDHVRNLS